MNKIYFDSTEQVEELCAFLAKCRYNVAKRSAESILLEDNGSFIHLVPNVEVTAVGAEVYAQVNVYGEHLNKANLILDTATDYVLG